MKQGQGLVLCVCPRIEEDEGGQAGPSSELYSVDKVYNKLFQPYFSEYGIEVIHGRLKEEEKQAAIDRLARFESRILVSTTVIEIGLDLPAAQLMIIINSERFGMSQLHQLRGRVGRSDQAAYCLLHVGMKDQGPLPERIVALAASQDGFELAEEDLKLRGPGEVMGLKQHGFPEFKIADLNIDRDLIHHSEQEVVTLLAQENPQKEKALLEGLRWVFGDEAVWARD